MTTETQRHIRSKNTKNIHLSQAWDVIVRPQNQREGVSCYVRPRVKIFKEGLTQGSYYYLVYVMKQR